MNCITLTLWRRPEYTRQCLRALRACAGIENYAIIIGINPDPATVGELAEIADGITFGQYHTVMVHDHDLGCNLNKRAVLDLAFTHFSYVVQIEDDVILAPDALRYFEWARQFERDESLFTVTAYGHDSGSRGQEGRVCRQPFFTCYGWATWKDRWEQMRAAWPCTYSGEPYWDQVLCYRVRDQRCELYPRVSRTINIGADAGLHGSQKGFDYWAGSEGFTPPEEFRL